MTQALDDPILELEHQLVTAAREVATARTHVRWRVAAAAGAVALLALGAVIGLSVQRPSKSLAATALAQLSPDNGIAHLRYETSWYSDNRVYARTMTETWYTSRVEHSIGTNVSVHGARSHRYLEVVRTPRTLRSYESGARTLTTQSACQARSKFPSLRAADPINDFRFLYAGGKLHDRGTAIFDGKRVGQLVANEKGNEFTYLVDPDSGELVAMKVVPTAMARIQRQAAGHFTGTIVRFLSHDQEPVTRSTRKGLEMKSHPGARLMDLGSRYCRHR